MKLTLQTHLISIILAGFAQHARCLLQNVPFLTRCTYEPSHSVSLIRNNRDHLINLQKHHRSCTTLDMVAQNEEEYAMDDEELLKSVKLSFLQDLATQQGLKTSGTKKSLLMRLRAFANKQTEKETSKSVSIQYDSSVDDSATDEGIFYFSTPDTNATTAADENRVSKAQASSMPKNMPLASDMYVNEKGERVVTVFNTNEEADLTKFGPHSRPGGMDSSATSFADATNMDQGLTAADSLRSSERMEQDVVLSKKTQEEIDDAKSKCREFIEFLLDGTAPGFSDPSEEYMNAFAPFDPSSVSLDTLAEFSPYLRMSKGQILAEVLREVECTAVGHDGMAGDDVSKGGGHYRQVERVGSFLKGFRIAESRRIARDSASHLLNVVATEGAAGLDFALGTMLRGEGDGELNDDLLAYLEETITVQKRTVEKYMAADNADQELMKSRGETLEESSMVDVIDLDGMDVEEINLNDGEIRASLSKVGDNVPDDDINEMSPSEKLLMLLQSLLDRLKAEAAFTADENGKNLRLLAMCLNTQSEIERAKRIQSEVGGSLTNAESFADLLDGAIDYAERTSTALTPGKKTMDVSILRKIQRQVAQIQSMQAMNAAGVKSAKIDRDPLGPWQ